MNPSFFEIRFTIARRGLFFYLKSLKNVNFDRNRKKSAKRIDGGNVLYLTVLLFFYLLVFLPGVFSYEAVFLFIASIMLILFRNKEKVRTALLFSVLLFSLFSTSLELSEFSSPVDEGSIEGMYGIVVTEPVRRKNRYTGCNILLKSVKNRNGDYFSSNGKIYVISPDIKSTKGDLVFFEGKMASDFFLAAGGTVLKRNIWGKLRRKVNAVFIKSLPKGNVGNITSLLLTGTTLDGDSSISEAVRSLGLSHLISLSGMHLAFISSIVMPVLEIFLEKKKAGRMKNLVLLLFVYLAGLRPSLMRSLIFVLIIPLFGIEESFIFSLVFLIKLFPYYTDEVAAVLSFTSLSGLLMVAPVLDRVKRMRINILETALSSVAATVTSAPIVFYIFSSWQPYSFIFSLVGMPMIALLFVLTIIRFIIPLSDLLIKIILSIIEKSSLIGSYFPLSTSFTLYYPLSFVFVLLFVLSSLIKKRK